jgi:hypothetical protein
MSGDPETRSSEPARWDTFRYRKTVLAVARTLTSAIRLLEALPVFAGDDRVRVVFAVDERSRFSTGVAELIRGLSAQVEPWSAVPGLRCDLVITASEKLDPAMPDRVPVLVLPHGVGFHKYVPDVDSGGTRVSGLVDPAVLRRGEVWTMVTHPSHERQVTGLSPEVAGRTVAGGDTSYDLVSGSTPWRARYREVLGLAEGQRLVLVTSTWRQRSLLGVDPALPADLLGELPFDRYRVALVAHPNVWSREGSWNLRRVLDQALRGGLLLIDPTKGWHAAMAAADLVIGDHGSLSLYAATNGVPLLLAAFGEEEVVPHTALADLGGKATRLDRTRGLHAQVERAIAEPDTGLVPPDELFAAPGRSLELLRTWCYAALGLDEPPWPQEPAIAPDPPHAFAPVHTLRVVGVARDGVVTLQRYPHAADRRPAEGVWHVSVDDRERDVRRFADAAVIVRARVDAEGAPVWLRNTLDAFPGCRLVAHATPAGCAVRLRDGRHFTLTSPHDPALSASALYTLLVGGDAIPDEFELAGAASGRVAVDAG